MVLEPGLVILVALLVLVARRRRNPEKSDGTLLLLPLVVGLAFWFWSAPNPRFGQFLLWIAAATVVGETFRRSAEQLPRAHLVTGATGAIALVVIALAMSRGSLLIRPGPDVWFHPMMADTTATYQTTSGLLLHYPVSHNRCWDAPLPCTPYPAPNLRLRVPNDLAKGFQTDGPWQPTNWPNRGSHFLENWRAARAGPQ
jgi:hypothetical protein